VYETVFPEMISWIKDHSKKNRDTTAMYSLADHTKTLSFMLGDGIVPSNVKSGYLARLLIRRALRFMETLHLDATLTDAVLFHLSQLTTDFPSLKEHIPQIKEILSLETNRYKETIAKGEQLVTRLINEKQNIDEQQLITLYDTHGMPPTIVQSIAKKQNVKVIIPENFESKIADLHTHQKKTTEQKTPPKGLPKTIPLYYSDHYIKSFDATVLWTHENNEGTEVIFNQTAFYPEGGGQPHDTGMIITKNKKKYPVTNVYKENGSIIHQVNGPIEVGEQIKAKINWDRRYILMKHHTGTHVINGALREILGDHIWQAGSQLHVSDARFDYAHYKPLSISEQKKVEKRANDFIKKNITVNKRILDRNTAEKEYGFRLYQGGVPPGNSIRVLDIPGVDVEACGGTHLNNTGEIDKIRILRTERIQDGVNRIVFAASQMVDVYQEEEQDLYKKIKELLSTDFTIKKHDDIALQLNQSSDIFSVSSDQLPKTIQRFLKESNIKKKHTVNTLSDACQILFDNWKETKKEQKTASTDELQKLKDTAKDIPGTKYQIIIGKTRSDANVLAGSIIANPGYIIHLFDGKKVTSAASEDVDIDLRKQIVPAIGKILGGGGGGRPRMVQSGGPKTADIDKALEKAKELTIETLKK
jgi:alanyl-tRNA synthetase